MSSDLKSEDYKESYGGKRDQIIFFSNDSDFCFHIPIHEILDQKSLYGRKIFVSEKKQLFSKLLLRSDGGGTFRLHFWNLQKNWVFFKNFSNVFFFANKFFSTI